MPDETSLHILELLAEDARRPLSGISAETGLSALAVPNRIDRLREEGIIRRFTVDPGQSTPSGGMSVFVRLSVRLESVDEARDALRAVDPAQYLFVTADGEVVTHARPDGGSVRAQLDGLVNLSWACDYGVSLAESMGWSPTVSGTGFVLECVECGNTVTSGGGSAHIDGSFYRFYCSSCLGRLEDRYGRPEADANDD